MGARRFQFEHVPLLSDAGRRGCLAARDQHIHVPDGIVWGRGPQHDIVVAAQRIDENCWGVEEKDAQPVVQADGEILCAVGSRVSCTVAGDDADIVVAVGA